MNDQQNKIKEILNKYPKRVTEVETMFVDPNPWNPNQQPEIVFESLVKSIQKYGWLQFPVLRDLVGKYQIIDGEHRIRAAKQLEMEKVNCLILGDNDNRVTEEDAMLLTQLLNTRGTDDIIKKAKLLKRIQDSNQPDMFGMLPETASQIEEELKLLNFDFSQFENMKVEGEKGEYEKALSLSVNFDKELRKLHSNTTDVNLKLIIEAFFDWNKKFQSMVSDV